MNLLYQQGKILYEATEWREWCYEKQIIKDLAFLLEGYVNDLEGKHLVYKYPLYEECNYEGY